MSMNKNDYDSFVLVKTGRCQNYLIKKKRNNNTINCKLIHNLNFRYLTYNFEFIVLNN